MKQRPRIHYTESQKALMWERWQKGESLQQIAQLFDRNHSSIQPILAATGGIRPAPRCRSRWALTLGEREEISRAVVAGHSMHSIAAQLGRAPSTISRGLKRNGGQEGYRASQADHSAWDRGRRPKTGKLAQNRALARLVAGKLQLQWSPEQVAGWLKRTYPEDTSRQVSHETIYRSLFVQARGALKKELVEHLRRPRVMRRSRHHTQKTDQHGRITDAVSISARPASVADRALPGHWEGDLLFGSKNSQIATLVERQSRYVMLARVDGKDTQIARVFEQLQRKRPAGIRYASFKLEDGVSFVHMVCNEAADGRNPLPELSAFKTFAAGVKERCEEPPTVVELSEVGSYGFFGK